MNGGNGTDVCSASVVAPVACEIVTGGAAGHRQSLILSPVSVAELDELLALLDLGTGV